jgi:hypothetical protein
VVLINGQPFELKSIYGLENEGDAEEGEMHIDDDDEDNLCKVCLDEEKDTLIMPCGHLCVCKDCSIMLKEKNPLCPMCRQAIGSLIPIKRKK